MSSGLANQSSPSGGIAKVLVVGNVSTGKTSVINRFSRNKYSGDYQTTIGVDFALKRIKINGNEMNIQLWDIAGQERFTGLSRIFYSHAVAAVIVYDVTDRGSFNAVQKWKNDIDNKVFLPSGKRIPVLLLGNKCDLLSTNASNNSADDAANADAANTPLDLSLSCVGESEIDSFVKENHFYSHFNCSAKTGMNVKEAFTHLVSKIYINYQNELLHAEKDKGSSDSLNNATTASSAGNSVTVSADNNAPASSGGCC